MFVGRITFPGRSSAGIAALFGVLTGASLVEAGRVHLVLVRWSALAAWIVTGLSVYGALCLTAVARSFVLRPVLMDHDFLVVRTGTLWSSRILTGSTKPVSYPLCTPNVALRLSQPVTAHGLYGMRREVSTIELQLDNRDAFLRSLTHGD